MTSDMPGQARQLRSLVTADGRLVLSLATIPVPVPGPDEVVVRIEASPINPSDLGLLLAGADLSTAAESGTADDPVLTADIPAERRPALAARVGVSMPVGNEGAGVVVLGGSSGPAQALLGRTVAVHGGAMYAQFRCVKAAQCLVLPEGTRPSEGASAFVNPLTALGMVATMRREGHTALVHTAAASNLGQMLHRLCLAEEIPLVNIVRRPEQEKLLRDLGAAYVCDSNSPTFARDLTAALAATSATLAFDATGGGRLAGRILAGMEAALTAAAADTGYNRYGSATRKQVYIYGSLHPGPTVLDRTFGMAWGIGGWLVTYFLAEIGSEEAARLRRRVAAELKTTFASRYGAEVSLAEALRLGAISRYAKQATGGKFLINPAG